MHVFSYLIIVSGLLMRIHVVGYKAPHTSGRNRHEQVAESLNVKGLYSTTQHPLYMGNFLIWLGISLQVNRLVFVLGIISFSLFFLYTIIRVEEQFLQSKFGEVYKNWKDNTPAWWMNPILFQKSENSFHGIRVLATEYPTWVSVFAGFVLVGILNFVLGDRSQFQIIFIIVNVILALLIGFLGRWFKYVLLPNRFKHLS